MPQRLVDLLRARAAATGQCPEQIYFTEMAKILPKPKLQKVLMTDASTSPMKLEDVPTVSVPQSKKRSIFEIVQQQ